MVKEGKKEDFRFWDKWKESGAISNDRVGEAYAFFNCEGSTEEIADEFLTIRELAETPRRLEIYISEGGLPLIGEENYENIDPELLEIAINAKKEDIRYVLRARGVSMSNRGVASELSAILNQAYQSPLFRENEEFRGAIGYKARDGRFEEYQ